MSRNGKLKDDILEILRDSIFVPPRDEGTLIQMNRDLNEASEGLKKLISQLLSSQKQEIIEGLPKENPDLLK